MPKLADMTKCTGCTACMNVCPKHCIDMEVNRDGFQFPKIDLESCIGCNSCEKVCPVLEKSECKNEPEAYAAFSLNESLRKESSSGGVFSEIAKYVIEQQGVVYGAAYGEKFEVCHTCTDTMDGLTRLRGAKYSASNLNTTFKDVLERLKKDQLVLFSGTPCQVAGLKKFVKKDYENLICIDFVCHGIPSPMAWRKYIEYRSQIDNDGQDPVSINLRSKDTGWSRYQYSNQFKYGDGTEYSSVSSNNLFMKLFVGDYLSRPSCSECSFKGCSRVSDFTIGDFWGIWDIHPDMDDNKGTSVVLVQNQKAFKIWDKIKNNLMFKQVTLEEASRQNPSMLRSSKSNVKSAEVLELIYNDQIEECSKYFISQKATFTQRVKRKIKRMLDKKTP